MCRDGRRIHSGLPHFLDFTFADSLHTLDRCARRALPSGLPSRHTTADVTAASNPRRIAATVTPVVPTHLAEALSILARRQDTHHMIPARARAGMSGST
jgi:hypothetical protein